MPCFRGIIAREARGFKVTTLIAARVQSMIERGALEEAPDMLWESSKEAAGVAADVHFRFPDLRGLSGRNRR